MATINPRVLVYRQKLNNIRYGRDRCSTNENEPAAIHWRAQNFRILKRNQQTSDALVKVHQD